jgi:hypothetical protein
VCVLYINFNIRRQCIGNVLITWCADHISRVWAESVHQSILESSSSGQQEGLSGMYTHTHTHMSILYSRYGHINIDTRCNAIVGCK